MDNRRQNFGTVVTTEGMWMIGGLFESASDLPTRKISKRFNIPGLEHFYFSLALARGGDSLMRGLPAVAHPLISESSPLTSAGLK